VPIWISACAREFSSFLAMISWSRQYPDARWCTSGHPAYLLFTGSRCSSFAIGTFSLRTRPNDSLSPSSSGFWLSPLSSLMVAVTSSSSSTASSISMSAVSSAVYSDSRYEDVDSSPGGFSSGLRRQTSSQSKVSRPCRRIILANRVTSQTDRQSQSAKQAYPASCCAATESSVTSV
jgi:hypothetical protein